MSDAEPISKPKRTWRWQAKRLAVIVGVLLLGVVALAFFGQRWLVFPGAHVTHNVSMSVPPHV